MSEIMQSTVNHESIHFILDEEFSFFANHDSFDSTEQAKWAIKGLDFLPADTMQIHEFIAHAV